MMFCLSPHSPPLPLVDDDYVTNEVQVAEDMFQFLQTFMKQFPQYANLPFFVTGESYAVSRYHQSNNHNRTVADYSPHHEENTVI